MKHHLLLPFRSNFSNMFLNEIRKKDILDGTEQNLIHGGKWILTKNCCQPKVRFNHLGVLKIIILKGWQRFWVISRKIRRSLDLLYSIIKISLESRRLPNKHLPVYTFFLSLYCWFWTGKFWLSWYITSYWFRDATPYLIVFITFFLKKKHFFFKLMKLKYQYFRIEYCVH